MNDEPIRLLATATESACLAITGPGRAALQASLDQACGVPAGCRWEHRAAAHAEFFTALAGTAGDPRAVAALHDGAGLAFDLMLGAGPAAHGIVVNSRKRMLAHLRAGKADEAAREMEKHLRTLYFMGRLAPASRRRDLTRESPPGT